MVQSIAQLEKNPTITSKGIIFLILKEK